jgi:hypothetical protein
MAEQVNYRYNPLFQLHLLHHYWLDEGATVFDLIQTEEQRVKRLSSYDMRTFLAVAPTAATVKTLAGLGGVSKETALGFIVAVPNDTVLPVDTTLEFAVTVRD